MEKHVRWWPAGLWAVLLVSLLGLGTREAQVARATTMATYADVPPQHWAFAAVERLAGAGLSGGCGTGLFCPEVPVTRAQLALLLGRAFGGSGGPPVPSRAFSDVAPTDLAAGWIEWSVTQGLLGTCAQGRFCPGDLITRGQLAVYLLRARYGAHFSPPAAQGTVFSDVSVQTPAAAWIERLAAAGLSGGCGGGRYCPKEVVTRAQLAVLLVRVLDALAAGTDSDGDGLSDHDELTLYHTDPLAPDTDDDGFSDGAEVAAQTNPLDSISHPIGPTLPPDPATVAPPVDATVVTTVDAATQFLYTGAHPIQTGVAPGTIEPKRVAVLRGKVTTSDGQPLAGVTVTVLNHPEYGQTLSRADGQFDLAANGGGLLTLHYQRTGYLPAQRHTEVPWQDYVLMKEVALLAKDSQVTTVDLTAPIPIQVARGSPVTDQDGTRQATLFIPQGVQASRLLPDGSIEPLTTLNLRLTEYTVGERGPQRMPAELPPTSAYTYAVELSADEATTKLNGQDVLFNQPVPFYVENFLNFPIGIEVPVGYYDNNRGVWVPYDNGRIIKILRVTGGRADLDVNGSGTPADATALAALGISDAERERLASLYSPGQSLWRVLLTHLSTWDCNWPFSPPEDAQEPKVKAPENADQHNPDVTVHTLYRGKAARGWPERRSAMARSR